MSEAQWENESIRRKIENLHTLPEGYDPRLDSKWELLETSLGGVEKKRNHWLKSTRRMAAVLLLLLAVAFGRWFYQPIEQTGAIPTVEASSSAIATHHEDAIRKPEPPMQIQAPVVMPKQLTKTKKHASKNAYATSLPVENPMFALEKTIENKVDSLALETMVIPPDTGLISAGNSSRTSRRYEEFDFGAPVKAVPAPVTTRQNVQLRLGQPVSPASPDSGPAEPAIRFRF